MASDSGTSPSYSTSPAAHLDSDQFGAVHEQDRGEIERADQLAKESPAKLAQELGISNMDKSSPSFASEVPRGGISRLE